MENLIQKIEALIFTAETPLSGQDIFTFFDKIAPLEVSETDILEAISLIEQKFNNDFFAFTLFFSGGGYQFLTKSDYHLIIAEFQERKANKKLTTAALETLAIIAYKQPVAKSEIEQIRGVSSDYTIQKLMEKELVEIKGRSEEVGRPLLYGTSTYFMDYFGINNLDELPKLKEFKETENQIGEKEGIEQKN